MFMPEIWKYYITAFCIALSFLKAFSNLKSIISSMSSTSSGLSWRHFVIRFFSNSVKRNGSEYGSLTANAAR